ncbi:glycosyltransferase family 2 protein [Desulfonatronum sp. SC1]|uniref:glycosyltransferase family 2 protein n=1 Tax=Desulfonatronum sp. SC1 TaxID=2109626 RepID=UPI000D324C94|nr:glycosyltransferase family 2 protein [Desulfonatronum sp. SC1]PTN38079.1 glycosyl transferase family 2 [Desulfonatronum sp. SC1]
MPSGVSFLISIITPTFNSAAFMAQTAASVRSQTHQDWEWLITDDFSQDGTWAKLQALCASDNRIKAVRNDANKGPAFSRNCSMDRAKGQYFAFLDADDVWLPSKLEAHLDFMTSGNIPFSFTAFEIIDQHGQSTGKIVDGKSQIPFNYKDMLRKKATMGCSTVMIERSLISESRMPELRTGQDYAFWLALLRTGVPATCLPIALTKYRIVPGSISRNKIGKARRQWQIYRELEKLGFLESATCFSSYAWRAVFRK